MVITVNYESKLDLLCVVFRPKKINCLFPVTSGKK